MLRNWLLVIIWATLIFLGSSLPGASVSENRTVDFAAHKVVHLFEYSILFILIYRAVKKSLKVTSYLYTIVGKLEVPISFGLTLGYAITDEIHQMFVRGRDAKLTDVLIDAGAALLGWLVIKVGKRLRILSLLFILVVAFQHFAFSADILSFTVPEGFELKEGELDHLSSTSEIFNTRGAAINFKPDFNFALSGFATFVYSNEKYYGTLDPSAFSLTIYEGLMEHANLDAPLSNRVKLCSELCSAVVEGKAGQAPTYQLFFAFDPIAVKGGQDYTAILEVNESVIGRYRFWFRRQYQDGFALFFNPQTKKFSRPSSASVAAPFALFVKEGWRATPPRFHPVVLIHGMGGKPSDWRLPQQDYVDLIQKMYAADPDFNYPSSWIHLYHYGFDKRGVYNYQGDVREIALGMEGVVDDLASRYAASFGESLESLGARDEDRVVDVVGYSLGGLVARQYLATHKDNHHVRKLITIATPHKGSWVMDFDQDVKSLPAVGEDLESALSSTFLKVWETFTGRSDQPFYIDAPAVTQVTPGSEFLTNLNRVELTPLDVSYATVYGQIKGKLERKIFGWTFSKEVSVGDIAVLPDSATFISGVEPQQFGKENYTVMSLKMSFAGDEVSWLVEIPGVDSLEALHSNLLKTGLVKNSVVSVLSS